MPPAPFTELVDVAAERLGGAVILASDEFFAPKENLLKAATPEWRENLYTDRGKWMDGWETRRRRTPGHDWCLVRLGVRARLHGAVVDTSFFRGNHPEGCALEACDVAGVPEPEALAASGDWRGLLSRSTLQGDRSHGFPLVPDAPVTHLRFSIFPDGGVARLRVYGEPTPHPGLVPGASGDLAALESGGLVVACSDMFFGHRHNIILPGRATHMADGWETRRRRGPGHDWIVVRLAARGVIAEIEVDTDHFKGNAPESCSVEVCDAGRAADGDALARARWVPVLGSTPLQPHARHRFRAQADPTASHARLNIHPDGGIARLRLIGTVSA